MQRNMNLLIPNEIKQKGNRIDETQNDYFTDPSDFCPAK